VIVPWSGGTELGFISDLRPMREDDLPQVLAIEGQAYGFPWTERIFRDCLRVGYACWVLEWGGDIVGYGVMSVAAGESHILNLCVRPDAQNQGHGRRILTHLLFLARSHHADTALLEVRPSNRAAIHLYRRMGFNEVGMRRGYYPGEVGREDAIILARDLSVLE
jgi:ribosomal-protein-alanine N-acetyltransferase